MIAIFDLSITFKTEAEIPAFLLKDDAKIISKQASDYHKLETGNLKLETMCNFLITEQKQHLRSLEETLGHIESCNLLGEIDPAYYVDKKNEYILQYAHQLSQLAQTVFEKKVHTPNALLIGNLKVMKKG